MGALLVLTAIEVVLAYRQVFKPLRMLEILLVLSVIKSALIIGYFRPEVRAGADALAAGDFGDGLLRDHVFSSFRTPTGSSGWE